MSTPASAVNNGVQRQFIMRADPYSKLYDKKATVRQTAYITLIEDIIKNEQRDVEEAKKNNTEVKKNADGLSVHLEYALQRLLAGFESTEPYARIGFSSALQMVLNTFKDVVTDSILESMIIKRHQKAFNNGKLTTTEQQSFDFGCLFLIQVLYTTKRLVGMSAPFLQRLLNAVTRLSHKHPQMYDLSVETLVTVTEACYQTSEQHYQLLLDALKTFIPTKTKAQDKNVQQVNPSPHPLVCQWRPATISAALCLRRLGHASYYEQHSDFVGLLSSSTTWKTMFDIIYPSLQHYPVTPSVWKHILLDLLAIPGNAFVSFWQTIIVPSLVTQFAYAKKGLALNLITILLTELNNNAANVSEATLQMVLDTVLSENVIKMLIIHARAPDTPLHVEVMELLTTLEAVCKTNNSVIPSIIGIFTTPSRGGSRLFDTKSGTKFVKTIITLLQPNDLIKYIELTMENFYNVNDIVFADIKHTATLAKQHDDEIATLNKDGTEAAEAKPTMTDNEDDAVVGTFERITNVDEFMASDVAKKVIAQGIDSLEKWSIDHVYHLCDLLLKLQQQDDYIAKEQQKEKKEEATKKQFDAAQVDACLKKCVAFLYNHAFYKEIDVAEVTSAAAPAPKSGKKKATPTDTITSTVVAPALKIKSIPFKTQDLCQQRYISLFSTLLQQSGANAKTTTEKVTKWGTFIFELDTQLRTVYNAEPRAAQAEKLLLGFNDTTAVLKLLQEFDAELFKKKQADSENKIHQEYADLVINLKYLISTTFALTYTDANVIVPLLNDYAPIVERVQKEYAEKTTVKKTTKRKNTAEEDDLPWTDVLIDILLALLGLGHAFIRTVVMKVFSVLAKRLTMASLHDLITTLVKQVDEQGEDDQDEDDEDGDDSDLDGLLDFDEDDEEEENNDDINIGAIMNEFNEAVADADEDDEDDEEYDGEVKYKDLINDEGLEEADEDNQKLGARAIADILLDTPNDYIPKDQEDAIQQIVKINKQKAKMQKNKLKDEMTMKLRILDLIELLIDELPLTNAWLSLLMPCAVLISSTRHTVMAPLHQRITLLFKNKLCNPKVYQPFQQLQQQINANQAASIWQSITVYDDVEKASATFDIIAQDKCNGDSIKSILEAIFESLQPQQEKPEDQKNNKKNQQQQEEKATDKSTIGACALMAAGTALLTAPAGLEEQANVINEASASSTAKKTTRGKKATTLSQQDIQYKIYQKRVAYFAQHFAPLVESYFSSKKEQFSPSFFTTLFDTPSLTGYMWGAEGAKPVVDILQTAVDNAASQFLCKQASECLSLVLKHYKYAFVLHKEEHILTILKQIYNKASGLFVVKQKLTPEEEKAAKQAKIDAKLEAQKAKKQQKNGDVKQEVKQEEGSTAPTPANNNKQQQKKEQLQTKQQKLMRQTYQKVAERSKSLISLLEQRMLLEPEQMTIPLSKKQLELYNKERANKPKPVVAKPTAETMTDEIVEEEKKEEPAAVVEEAPKKRGRRPKTPVEEEKKEEPAAPVADSGVLDEEVLDTKPNTKKRKAPAQKQQEEEVEPHTPAPTEDKPIEQPKTPTKRATRGKKATVETEETQQEEVEQPKPTTRSTRARK